MRRCVSLLVLLCGSMSGAIDVLPTPQSAEVEGSDIVVRAGDGLTIVTASEPSGKLAIAADLLRTSLVEANQAMEGRVDVRTSASARASVRLWDRGRDGTPPILLSAAERAALDPVQHYGQSYVLKAVDGDIWIVGSSDQGVLYGVTTLAQLIEADAEGVRVPGIRIIDYPDFRYRAAADWLLRAELNRWGYDWGDGRKAYIERIKRKLDFCTRFKINMVFFDGFGWGVEKRPGYAAMMREFSAYARERGIKLMFGGFGANFEPSAIEPQFNIGRILLNRHAYPDGEVYRCFGEGKGDYPTYGTCRSNEALLQEIAREFESFVRAVEPGALYIHHEDTGHYETTQARWHDRCDRCKRKWPNPDFAAIDGGAGAMAAGYANIVRAVQRVTNSDTGYDAARDCTIVLISPPYGIDSRRSGLSNEAMDLDLNWEKTLEYWTNVVSLLPRSDNLEVGFREIFPHPRTGRPWLETYRERLSSRDLSDRVFLFFLGGADSYSAGVYNFPYTANAAMNGLFKGAETIYNFNGRAHQEPQQVMNAEFAWNIDAPGSYIPATFHETLAAWHARMNNEVSPGELFGEGGLLDRACARIYGRKAGQSMAQFFRYYEKAVEQGLPAFYPRKVYPLVVLWRALEGDRPYWNLKPTGTEGKVLAELQIERPELHRRLASLWHQTADVNRKVQSFVEQARKSDDLRADAAEDVARLMACLSVGQRFATLLAHHHQFLAAGPGSEQAADRGRVALSSLNDVASYVDGHFSFDIVDPRGGDTASWLETLEHLRGELLK